jgi:hypothetical protein
MTIDKPETPISSAEVPTRGWRVSWVVAAVVIVVAALLAGAIAARGGDSNDDAALGTQQLAAIQLACTTWHDGYTGAAAPTSAWCSDMVAWMTGQARSGQMMGSMMWSNADQMRATCQAWLSSSQEVGGAEPDASAWCDQMVDWMTQHMGQGDQWDRGWMMNGPMMGR